MQLKSLIVQSIFWRGLYFVTVLLLNVSVARFFKASGSGWIYYVSSLYAFAIVIVNLSLDSGIGFYTSKKEISVNKLLTLSVFWTLIVALIVAISTLYYLRSTRDSTISASLMLVSSLGYICGNLLNNYCNIIFYAHKNFYTPNVIGSICNILLVILLLITSTGTVPVLGTTLFLYIYFLSFLVQGLLMVGATIISYVNKRQPVIITRPEFKKVLRYSMMAFLGNIIFLLVYRVDYFFVRYYCSAADLGNYIQVSKLGQMVILVPSFMASAVSPMVAAGHNEEVNRSLKLLSRISILLIGSFCILVAVTGNWLFPFIFGKSFDRMHLPFILLLPGILSLCSLYPLAAYYSGKNRLKVNIIGSSIGLAFIILADFIFIPRFGINAAAITSSIGYICYHSYVLFIYKKEYKVQVADFFMIKKSDFRWLKKFVAEFRGRKRLRDV